jgi:hypothetical protein
MSYGFAANENKRAFGDVGVSVSPTGEVAASEDLYMNVGKDVD